MDAGFWEAAGLPEEAARARERETNSRLDGPVKGDSRDREEKGEKKGGKGEEGAQVGRRGARLVNQFPYEACIVMKHHLARTVQQVSEISTGCESLHCWLHLSAAELHSNGSA